MTELLTLILSDFKHFIGTLILMGWAGAIVMFGATVVVYFIKTKR